MGMYDTLYIKTDKLPISDEEKILIDKHLICGWQTKDLECMMTEVYITDEGKLKVNKHNWGWDDTKINGFGCNGVLTRENERIEAEPYTGVITFYSDIKDDWYEFNAKFTDGNLDSIEGGKCDPFPDL